MKNHSVYAKWKVHSACVRSALNLPGKSSPWTARGDVTLHGLGRPSARVLDVLDVAWSCRRNSMPGTATSEDLKRGFWANVSQAVQRRPWGPLPLACKITIMYSFAEERVCCQAMASSEPWAAQMAVHHARHSVKARCVACPVNSSVSRLFACFPLLFTAIRMQTGGGSGVTLARL